MVHGSLHQDSYPPLDLRHTFKDESLVKSTVQLGGLKGVHTRTRTVEVRWRTVMREEVGCST